MKKQDRRTVRAAVLTGVSTAALIVAASAAWAAPAPLTHYSLDLAQVDTNLATVATQTQYLITAGIPQLNTGDSTATITGSSVTNTFGDSAGFPAQASNNTFSATAISLRAIPAPGYDYIANLGAIGNTGTNDGIGILHPQLTGNTGTGAPVSVTASIVNPAFTNTNNNSVDFTSGSVDTSNNSATATVTVNQISPDYQVRGTVPTGYSSAVQGSSAASIVSGVVTINNSASVSVTSTQTAFDAGALSGSAATISGATIGNTFSAPTAGAISVSAPQTVDGNTVQATFAVNSAHNIFLAETGDSPTYNGSVVVSNYQGNTELGGTPANAASVTNTAIGVNDLSNTILDADITLAGAAAVSNNTVGAKATGNTAGSSDIAGGNPTIGNAIIFQNGLNVAGTGSTASNILTVPQTPADSLTGTTTGDLILGNGQGNNGTQLSALTGGTTIVVNAGDIGPTGTATLNGNAISGSATGNSAVGAIQALGGSSFAGTAVYASLQANDATTISSTVTDASVGAILGGGADSVANGTVTVSSNAVSSSATGNTAGDPTVRSIAIDAANFNSTASLATVTNQTQYKAGVPVTANTGGGISASNVQGNWGTTPISATIGGSGAGISIDADIVGVTATVNTNTFAATASGNVGYTSVALTGSQGALSAGLSNAQYQNNPVSATVVDSGVDTAVDGSSTNSIITVNGNSLSASASADSAVNSLSATGFSSLTLGAAGDVMSTSTQYVAGSSTSTVIGALALNSNQTNDGNVTASIASSLTGLAFPILGDSIQTTPVTVNGNSAATSAIGSQATNTLTLSPGTLTTASGNADNIASLGNVQYQGGGTGTGVAISSTVDLSAANGAFGAIVDGSVTDSPITVSGNGVSAFAAGNIGNNTLTVTGTNYAAGAPGVPLQGVQSAGVLVQAEFALQNAQFDNSTAAGNGPGSRTATITAGNVGISLTDTGTIAGSALTVSGNTLDTDARNNYASNTLNLTGFSTLSTSAGVQNFQNSTSTVTSTVADGKIGIDADGYDALLSPLAVTGNGSQARAIANTAFNTMSVGGESLGGNSGNTGASLSMAGLPDTTTDYVATADYALGNSQNVTASTTAGVSGVFFIDLATGALNGSSATVTGNSMKALAENNNSVNTLNIAAGTTTTLGGALMSEQRSTAPITSATAGYGADLSFGGVQIGSASGSPISVSGNTLSAMATNNDATNVLNAVATSNLTGQGTTGQAIIGTTGPTVAVTADYSVFNVQNTTGGATSATANPGQWGVTVGTTTGTSPVTVQNNSVTAQSHVNDASNTMTLGGTNVSATGSLGSWQNSSDTSTATITGGTVGFIGGDAITTSPLNVSGNSFIASAGGNGATNALNVTATNYTMPINGVASGGTVTGGGYQATATYAVLNMQQNSGAVSSLVTGLNVGINIGGGTPSAVSGSPMTVSGNTVVASAYGNNANNTITLSAGIGTLPSASLTSSQVNSAAITSTVTGANIGINVGANTGSSGVSSNNNVGAIAIGNSAGNTIGIR